jgi:hypothetical protein
MGLGDLCSLSDLRDWASPVISATGMQQTWHMIPGCQS